MTRECAPGMRIFHHAAILMLILAGSAGADVYKWTDADGSVHYGDRPPASGQDARSMSLAPAPSMDADHDARSLKRRRLLEAFEAERIERGREAAEAAAAEAERNHRCDGARRMLAGLERANVVYTTDESGTREYMSDEERHRAEADMRAWIGEHCR